MNFTPYERLTLSLQLRRLAEETEIDSYAQQAEIIEDGYTSLYGEVFGITTEPELDADVQEEVFQILSMFRALHPGHSAGEDWNPDGDRYYQKFRGFDGNHDLHFGFAKFLIEKMGRFAESAPEFNSHGHVISIYQAMLRRWDTLGRPQKPTEDQIDEVVGR